MVSQEKKKLFKMIKEISDITFLATVDGEKPDLRPVTFRVDDDFGIWINTASSSNKVKQIKRNNHICLSVPNISDFGLVVTIYGIAEIIQDLEKKKFVWDLSGDLLKDYFPGGPESEEFCVLKVNVDKAKWWDDDGELKVVEFKNK
jgi:general stress protein 26